MSLPLAIPVPTINRMRQAALPLLFVLLGVVYATWASRIPAVRDALQLDPAELSLVLLCAGIGAVGSFPLAAWLTGHYGARHSAWYAGVGLLVTMPCLALAPNMAWLMLTMTSLGLCSGCFDVAINALGAAAEKVAARSIMSLLHAWFCVGTLSGALIGSGFAGIGLSPLSHFGLLALLFALPLRLCYYALPNDRPEPSIGKKYFSLPHGHLIVLGIIGFCGAIVEGSVADWSGVYMTDWLRASDGTAPLAFAAFAAMMLVTRLIGDRLKERFNARKVVTTGALIAAVGMFVALIAPNVSLSIFGFALTGVGVATVFPFVFSAAGRHGSTALAGVATLSYGGGLIGPPVIGFLAHGFGLHAALSLVGVLCLAVALSASRAKWLE
ncbi:MFS transporter [Glaciimonas sp. Gout2]|uniref:MFS transporter n=1 Tax=unclassified Glaciimonas TaxID=2644401 RepID=UPI002B23DD3C|nr:MULTISPECIES: MFS transporter [unclassified Glaciimonas]MEB0012209.1 MFS transporter [Glaciimonas sp. Cout2]MEB0082392.1 MFS transporter [Glaciimonas sp. Gout2]